MSLKARGLLARKNSRIDQTEQLSGASRKIYESESPLLRCEDGQALGECPGVGCLSLIDSCSLGCWIFISWEQGFTPFLPTWSRSLAFLCLGSVWFDLASVALFLEHSQDGSLTFPDSSSEP